MIHLTLLLYRLDAVLTMKVTVGLSDKEGYPCWMRF